MRIFIPSEVAELLDIVTPYVIFDDSGVAHLTADAPKNIVEAKRKLDEWHKDHKRIKD